MYTYIPDKNNCLKHVKENLAKETAVVLMNIARFPLEQYSGCTASIFGVIT